MSFGSKPSPDYGLQAGSNAYNAASQGQDWGTIVSNSQGYESQARAGFDKYQSEQQESSMYEQMFMSMMGGGETSGTSAETQQARYEEQRQAQQTSYDESLAARQAEYDRKAEEARMTQGYNDRDSAYSSYLDAAGTATDYITGEISGERSNAALLGIDYNITDEQKSTRINDYFATLWGGGQQSGMENLFSEFGNPQGFEGYGVTRGNAENYASKTTPEETLSTSKGLKPRASLATEETLGQAGSRL